MRRFRAAALSALAGDLCVEVAAVAAKRGIACPLRRSRRRYGRHVRHGTIWLDQGGRGLLGRAAPVEFDPRIVDVPIALDDLIIHVVSWRGITYSGVAPRIAVNYVLMDAVIPSQIRVVHRPVDRTPVHADILEAVIHIQVIDVDVRTRQSNPPVPVRPAMIVNVAVPPVEVDV